MSAGRRTARRQAVFLLYQQDLLKLDVDAALDRGEQDEIDDYASQIVRGVTSQEDAINTLLERHLSGGWKLNRLGVLERAILRVAAYELLAQKETPVAVVVDEAVNLAKRFCSTEASALVNGILGNVAVDARPADPVVQGEIQGA